MKIKVIVLLLLIGTICLSGIHVNAQELTTSDLARLSFDDLMNVTITTASKKEEKISDIPASVVVITKAEIEKYGYRSLQELLENVPGIYAIDNYAHTDVTLGVRGFWSAGTKGVVIMVNGVNQLQDVYSMYPLNRVAVPVESIERIEVIRGPMSVIYGSGAFYGAINIITKGKQNEEVVGQASVKVGSDKYYGASFNASVKKEDLSLNLIGSMYNDDGLNVNWKELSSDTYLQTGTTKKFFENSSYYYAMSGSYKGFSGDMNIVRDSKTWIFLGLDKNLPNRKLSDFANARIGYHFEVNDFSIDTKLGYYYTNVQSGNTFHHDPKDKYLDFSHWGLGSQAYDIDFYSVYKPSDDFDVSFGLNYRRLLQRYELLNMPSINYHDVAIWQPYDTKLQSGGAYIQSNWQLSREIRIIAGIRLEKRWKGLNIWEVGYGHPPGDDYPFVHYELPLEATKVQFIPRFALLYSMNERNVIKLLYGKAVRFPAYHENNDIIEAMTPSLQPEKINTIELNYIASYANHFTLNFSLFSNNLDNLIYRREYFDVEGDYHGITTNEGEMNTSGLEATVTFKPSSKFEADVSFTYQKTDDLQNEGREVTNSPEILAYAKVSYKVATDFFMSLSGNYVDGMVAQWNAVKDNDNGTFGGRIGDDVPSYFNLGLNIHKEKILKLKGLFADFKISNLLDNEIRYSTYSSSEWADKGTLGHGRRYMVRVGWKF